MNNFTFRRTIIYNTLNFCSLFSYVFILNDEIQIKNITIKGMKIKKPVVQQITFATLCNFFLQLMN